MGHREELQEQQGQQVQLVLRAHLEIQEDLQVLKGRQEHKEHKDLRVIQVLRQVLKELRGHKVLRVLQEPWVCKGLKVL